MRPTRGRDIQAGMTISFEEAVKGTKKVVDLAGVAPGISRRSKPIEINIPAGMCFLILGLEPTGWQHSMQHWDGTHVR